MMEVVNIQIRNYRKEDRKTIRVIGLQSSILGEQRKTVFDDEILADMLTVYFTDYEPQSCFVAEGDNQVIGYVLGTRDVRKMRNVMKHTIFPGLAKKVFLSGQFLQRNNLLIIRNMMYSYFKGEFKVPDFTLEYPATLHVNIASGYRGKNTGSLLVNHFLEFLKREGVSGIHFGVLSESAKRFFLKLNFEVLFEGKYSFLQYLSGETLPHYVMGKHL
jgi:GNAT superfamily N-acetyltransferase